MQLAEFPRWLRGLFAVFLILFFFNALYALAFFTAIWTLRIDPGVATLMGAIFGLGIVAWQARLRFWNLIRSQEHRAAIEAEARQHQHQLDVEREGRRIDEERCILMAALRAEIVGAHGTSPDHGRTRNAHACVSPRKDNSEGAKLYKVIRVADVQRTRLPSPHTKNRTIRSIPRRGCCAVNGKDRNNRSTCRVHPTPLERNGRENACRHRG